MRSLPVLILLINLRRLDAKVFQITHNVMTICKHKQSGTYHRSRLMKVEYLKSKSRDKIKESYPII